jgi:hypothetical protein
MARTKRALPDCLTKNVTVPMHPEIHRELKIASLREGFETVGEYIHQHFCMELKREDLMLQATQPAN